MSAACERWLRGRQIDSLLYLDLERPAPIQVAYQAILDAQLAALAEITSILEREGIEVIVFKGAEFLARYFASQPINVMSDVDILVRQRDVERVRALLRGAGFLQAAIRGSELEEFSADAVARAEQGHYELAAFRRIEELPLTDDAAEAIGAVAGTLIEREGRTFVAVTVDVHHGVATNVDGSEFFERAVPSATGCGAGMCSADHLWFTVSRYYTQVAHGKRSLRDFAYLARAVGDAECDWDLVLSADRRLDLGATLFYYLAFLDDLVGGVVPPEILRCTNPYATARRLDWGWQLSRLFERIDPRPPLSSTHDHAPIQKGRSDGAR